MSFSQSLYVNEPLMSQNVTIMEINSTHYLAVPLSRLHSHSGNQPLPIQERTNYSQPRFIRTPLIRHIRTFSLDTDTTSPNSYEENLRILLLQIKQGRLY